MTINNSYNIKYVSDKTGLSLYTLRLWENNYGAIKPIITESKRKVYNKQDIQKIILLQQAIELGYSIEKIAHYSPDELKRIINEHNSEDKIEVDIRINIDKEIKNFSNKIDLKSLIKYIKNTNKESLEKLLHKYLLSLDEFDFIDKVINPILNFIDKEKLDSCKENMVNSIIYHQLETIILKLSNIKKSGNKIVILTNSNGFSNLRTIIASILAKSMGFNIINLEFDWTSNEIVDFVIKNDVKGIILILDNNKKYVNVENELKKILELLPKKIEILVCESSIKFYENILKYENVFIVKDLQSLKAQLNLFIFSKPKIHIIDDDKDFCLSLVDYLEEHDYQVLNSFNGQNAKELIDKNKDLSLIIIDILLPDIDGIELCHYIRSIEEFRLTPILIISGKGDINTKYMGFNAGSDDFITKPFEPIELLLKIQTLIKKASIVEKEILKIKNTIPVTQSENNALYESKAKRKYDKKKPDTKVDLIINGKNISLTYMENEIIKYLYNQNHPVSSKDLIIHLIGHEGNTEIIRTHIKNIRAKIEVDKSAPQLILYSHQKGYFVNKDKFIL